MMRSRRDFLHWGAAIAGLPLAASCGLGAAGGERWTPARAGEIAGRHGSRGWAAWQGRSRTAAWQSGATGPVLSITKTLASLAATRMGLDPTDRAAATLTEWRGDARKERITIGMLLQQTSGLEAGVAALYRGNPDKGRLAIALQAIDEPGTVFRYGPAHWEVLAELMRRRQGSALEPFLHREVLGPLGLRSANWRADRLGRDYLSTGAELSVEDLGKLGRALAKLLSGENTDGFDADRFARLTRPSGANPMFGGGLWRNGNVRVPGTQEIEVEKALDPPRSAGFWRTACLSTRQPADLVALIGSSGRRVFIWPSQRRVFARLGVSSDWQDRPFLAAAG